MIKKIKNPLIEKSRFLIIPEPFEGEIFSSWFARCAYAHKTHPRTFWNLHFPKDKYICTLTHNIDASVTDEILQILSIKTSFGIKKLRNMTMLAYEGYLQEQIIRNGTNKFLTNYRICPKCFQEDKIPYIRKENRIIFSTFCKKHKCFLVDKCPKCQTLIFPFKMFRNEFTYEFCNNCGFELANSEIKYIRNEYRYKMNHKLFDVLNKGYIELENYYIYSFLFFDVIAHISRLILMNKRFNMSEKRILNYITKKKISKAKSSFSQLSIKEQFILFSVIMNIFEEFPQRFKLFMLENKLSNFEMIRDMKKIPFWYEQSINIISPKIIYQSRMITKKEIINGIKYLRRRSVVVNQLNISKLLGYNFFSSYNNLKKLFNELRTK